MYALNDINGALILTHANRGSIGRWNETEINTDISTKADMSIPGLAVAYFTDLATQTGTDLVANATQLNDALLWYICGKYKERDMQDKPGDQCSEEEYKFVNACFARSCGSLTRASSQMAALSDFCKYQTIDDIPEGLFTSVRIDHCGCSD